MPNTTTNNSNSYRGWDSISAGYTVRDAIDEAQRRGMTFQQRAEEIAENWDTMFPHDSMPDDLVTGIVRELETAAASEAE